MKRVALLAAALAMGVACHAELTPTASPPYEYAKDAYALIDGDVLTLANRAVGHILVVQNGKIACIGDTGACIVPGMRAIDLHGGTVIPGLADAHVHVLGLGKKLRAVDLAGCKDEDECAARIGERARSAPAGAWIAARGWDQTRWPGARFPTRASLDRVAGDHPVFAERVDGHAAWLNGRALDLAKIDASTKDPQGGRIERGDAGAPSGVVVDNAVDLVVKAMPPPSDAEIRDALVAAMKQLVAAGLTSVHDAGVDRRTLAVYKDLAEKDQLPIRVYAMLDGSAPMDQLRADMEAWKKTPTIGRLTVRAVKLYADGALGSRGAWLKEPYSDDPKNSGLAVTPPDELRERILAIAKAGFQPAVHAIGDRATLEVLDDFIAASKLAKDLRPRVEHLQILDPGDRMKLAEAQAVASMQPIHATSDGPWAELRLGHGTDRQKGAYAWRSAQRYARIACGSDFPVEDFDPRKGIYAAETREWPGGPAGGWMPEQRLTHLDALRCYTSGAAYAEHAEALRGTIELGRDADLTVFAGNVEHATPEQMRDMPITMTIVGGRVEHAR